MLIPPLCIVQQKVEKGNAEFEKILQKVLLIYKK